MKHKIKHGLFGWEFGEFHDYGIFFLFKASLLVLYWFLLFMTS